MLIEQALITFLLAQSTITTYTSTRIYQVQAPQDVTGTYMVVTKISGVRVGSHEGNSHLAHPRFQFSVFSTSYANAKNCAAALQTALQGYSGTMGGAGGVAVGNAVYEDENDFYEENGGLYQVACDYIIWHTE